jgi:hypothetical protein
MGKQLMRKGKGIFLETWQRNCSIHFDCLCKLCTSRKPGVQTSQGVNEAQVV